MSRSWFSQSLETVAVWWLIERRDGVTMGFTSHDRDLIFAGLPHRTAPGMVPSAVRRTATFDADSAEISGALSHDAINEADLVAGRFDGARVTMGLVDWETLEAETLFAGAIGSVGREPCATWHGTRAVWPRRTDYRQYLALKRTVARTRRNRACLKRPYPW